MLRQLPGVLRWVAGQRLVEPFAWQQTDGVGNVGVLRCEFALLVATQFGFCDRFELVSSDQQDAMI